MLILLKICSESRRISEKDVFPKRSARDVFFLQCNTYITYIKIVTPNTLLKLRYIPYIAILTPQLQHNIYILPTWLYLHHLHYGTFFPSLPRHPFVYNII